MVGLQKGLVCGLGKVSVKVGVTGKVNMTFGAYGEG